MNGDVTTPRELKDKYPYMFAGPDLGISFARGWFPSFVQLCVDVDQLLGEDRMRFRWIQVKEKFGTARFHFELGRARPGMRTDQAKAQLMSDLLKLTQRASLASATQCVICSAPASLDETDLVYMTLCPLHREQRKVGFPPLDPAWFAPDHSPQIISRLPHSEIESLRQDAKDNTVKMRELLRNA